MSDEDVVLAGIMRRLIKSKVMAYDVREDSMTIDGSVRLVGDEATVIARVFLAGKRAAGRISR